MRIFLDANVLFSASNETSNIARLIHLVVDQHEVVTSDLALEEARRNIRLKRPNWMDALAKLSGNVTIVPTRIMELPVPIADKDAPILASAIKSQCRYFVTGDKKHFGQLFDQVVEGVEIVSLVRLAGIVLDLD